MLRGLLFAAGDLEDAVAGQAGWAGAGLLGLVLSWLLLRHLPDLERSRAAEREAYLASLQDAQNRFDQALQRILEHCKEEMAVVADAYRA